MSGDILDRVEAMIELEKGEIKTALQERRRQIELEASQKLIRAKTELAKTAIKAKEAQDLAELEARAYQAELNAQAAQKRAKALRQQAGHYTKRERATKIAKKTGRVAKKAVIIGGRAAEGFGRGFAVPVVKAVGRDVRHWYKHYYDDDDAPKPIRRRTISKKRTASKRATTKKRVTTKRRTKAKAKK